jgi:uncharacterized protein (TIGR03435 family)
LTKRFLAFSVATILLLGAAPGAQTTAAPAFEVASVKPSNPNPDPSNPLSMIALMMPQPGGRFTATNTPLRMLIMAAFELQQEAQLAGGPPALLAAKYDITARVADTATIATKDLPPLLQSLLADRFKLKTHTETRELPAYDLVLARGDGRLGPELKPSRSDCSKPDEVLARQGAALAKGDVSSFLGKPQPCSVATDPSGGPLNLMLRADGQEMKQLAEVLTQFTGRPVRDKTGLTGRYDFAMKLDLQMLLSLAEKMGAPIPAGAAAKIPQSDGSSLMTTLNEQLGLKLESTRDSATVVVIDSVEAASED